MDAWATGANTGQGILYRPYAMQPASAKQQALDLIHTRLFAAYEEV